MSLLLALNFLGFLKGLIFVTFVLSAMLLILIVLLQEPKGGGLSGAFGGAGAETFGVQTGGVNKFTSYVAGAFLLLAILYAAIREPEPQAISDTVPAVTDTSGDDGATGGGATGGTEKTGGNSGSSGTNETSGGG
jgi:preprotein translocase subunit SecG